MPECAGCKENFKYSDMRSDRCASCKSEFDAILKAVSKDDRWDSTISVSLIAAPALAFCAFLGWFFLGPMSEKDRLNYGQQCAEWFEEEHGFGRKARVSDSWIKDGKLVFEISLFESGSSSSRIMTCVVDKEKGTLWR